MSDGLPSDEQLRRIEQGVMARIDARRQLGRRIAGTAAAFAIVGGGLALVGPFLGVAGTSGGGSTAAGGSATSAEDAAGSVTVLCHGSARRDSPARTVRADPAALPGSAVAACADAEFQSGGGRMPDAASDEPSVASGTPLSGQGAASAALAVCRATDDVLHVYPLGAADDAAARCAANGMTRADP